MPWRKRNPGLWFWLVLIMSLSLLILFAAFSALSEYALQYSADRIRNERLTLTRSTAAQIDGLLQEAVQELEEVVRLAAFDPMEPEPSLDILHAHASDLETLFIPGFVFLDTEGRVLLSDRPDVYALSADLSDLPYIAEALQSREFTISEPFVHWDNTQPVSAITIPVYRDSHFVGLLSSRLKLNGSAFLKILQQAAMLGDTGHATLIDSQGRTLAATLDISLLSAIEHPDFYPQALINEQPTVSTTEFRLENVDGETYGERHVMAFAPLTMTPWGVAAGGDEDETFAGVWQLRRGLALLAGITMVVVWTGTLFGTRQLIRPIQGLTAAAQKIADGKLHTSLQVSGPVEIGAMATSLERMRLQLLTNIEQLANWNETLTTRVAEQTGQLHQLLRQNLAAQEDERARLSRELHDEIGQMLTAIEVSLEYLAESLPVADTVAQERLEYCRTLVEKTVFDLGRVTSALRPGILDQLGLVPALKWVGDQLLHSLNIEIKFDTDRLPERLPTIIETILFRIAQEAMNNVARHSQARHLEIKLAHENEQVIMTLIDDGKGFDPSLMSDSPTDFGLGLAGMKERAMLIGGQTTITSALQQGTTITAVIPTTPLSICFSCPTRNNSKECLQCTIINQFA